jgi:hypothetical protein
MTQLSLATILLGPPVSHQSFDWTHVTEHVCSACCGAMRSDMAALLHMYGVVVLALSKG